MHRSVTRAAHGVLGAIFAVALGAAVAVPARADEPFRLDEQITDRVGALDDRTGEVQDALDRLYEDHRLDLWVVYVDNFSGYDWDEWADLTAVESDLGLNDVLLAVATGDRAYALSIDPEYDITDEQYEEIETVAVEPALRENDWAGAAIGAADGFAAVRSGEEVVAPEITPGDPEPSAGGSAVPWVIGGIAVVGVGAAGVYAVRRRRGTAGGARPDQLSIEDLRKHASALLVETDDAIKTSDQEVGFAQAQYGSAAAQPFAAAVAGAREHLDASFALKQKLDDDEPEDEATERRMLTEIVERLESANDELDAQAESFAALRDLERNAPEVLAKVRADAESVAGRIDGARATVAELAQTYTDGAAVPVAENPTQAVGRLEFATAAAAEADTKIAAGSMSEAAVQVQAAELAVGQAKELIDAVDQRAEELAKAADGVREALAEVEADIATSGQLAAGPAPAGIDTAALAQKVAAAEAVTSTVRTGLEAGRLDPLAALRNLEQSGQELDTALAGARDAQEKAQRAKAALDRTIVSARSRIAATSDFITTRRGAVGSEARTRLVEAQRWLDQAVATAAADPATALQYAQQADGYAQQAEQLAQRDVGGFAGGGGMGGMFGQQSGGSLNSAILGGILGSMLGGGGGGSRSSGGYGGGFGGGFGGSSRSRSGPSRSSSGRSGGSRRSRGGRF